MLIAVFFIIAKSWEQPQRLSIGEWTNQRGTPTQWNTKVAIKKKGVLMYTVSTDTFELHLYKAII